MRAVLVCALTVLLAICLGCQSSRSEVSPDKLRLLREGMSYGQVLQTLEKPGLVELRSDFGGTPLELRSYSAAGTAQTYCLFFEANRLTSVALPKYDHVFDLANIAQNSLPDMGGEAEAIARIHKAATPLSKINFGTVDQDLKNVPGDEAEDMGIALGFLNPLIWIVTAIDVHDRSAAFNTEQDLLESLTLGRSRDRVNAQLGRPSAQLNGGPDVCYLWYSKYHFVLGFRANVLKGVYDDFSPRKQAQSRLPQDLDFQLRCHLD